jgi:hypothetical protein
MFHLRKARFSFLIACAALPALLLVLSCPNPIDVVLARKVEDKTSPVITIITPDPATTYYYGTSIDIAGTIVDYADGSKRVRGEVKSISYEEVYDKRIHGELTPSSDGSFAFSIDAFDPVPLHGNLVILIKATDWNGNTAEKSILAYDRTTGPSVVVYDHGPGDFNGYTSSPAAGVTLTIRGVVEVPTFYLRFNVDPQVGPDVLDRDIVYDSETGDFSFSFSPSAEGASGELKFILRAADAEMESTTYFYLYDDPVAPQITSSTVAADNTRVSLTFSKGVYHTGGTDPILADFTLSQAGGPASAALSGLIGAPTAGATSIDLGLTVTGTPSGAETITITGVDLTDRVGNPLSPASISRSLHDKTCPGVQQVSSTLPAGSAYNAGDVVPVTVSFNEPVTVTPPLTLALNVGAAAVYSSGSGTSTITLNYAVQPGHNVDPLNYTVITDLAGTVTDLQGNPALLSLPDPPSTSALVALNLRIDTTSPAVPGVQIGSDELILKEENLAGVPFTVTGEDGAGYDLTLTNCTLIAGTDTGILPASGFALRATGTGTFTVIVAVTITDRAGNSSSGSDTCQADLTAPGMPNVSTPGTNPTNDRTPTWTWTSGGGGNGTYRYQLDIQPWQETTNPSFTPATDLSETEHILYVQERNAAGNWSESGSLAILVDATPPPPPEVTGPSSTSDHTPTWSWTPGEGGPGTTYRYQLDLQAEQQTAITSFTPATNICLGQSTLVVWEIDAAGNRSATSGSWNVDLIPLAPEVTVQAIPDATHPTWSWSSGCGGAGLLFRYSLDDPTPSTWTETSASSYTSPDALDSGWHTLYVQEQDADGDWSASGSASIEVPK